ncbi:MAG: magnesium transporter [Lachnospiraceae bacterium]|jgi:magnesium transporter|uniref:magnesium transporter CorA family protein n=1 Tax=Candidatus Merdisoma sp. JLR.KK006 TaxID=3112626 RepID=UPI002FF349EA|nr:magnesium transporter [Lachnospiraceae bacterium]
MFYSIHEKEIKEVTLEQIDSHDICVGYLTLEELRKCYEHLGLSEVAVKDCMTDFTHFRTSIDVYDEFSFGMINIVDILNLSSKRNRIGFFIKKNLFIIIKIIDKDDSIRQMFLDAIGRFRQNATMEKVIYGVLERLLSSGNRGLVMTERQIIAMEREVVNGKMDEDLNKEIFDLRNRLSTLKNYYDQLIDIGEALQENENDLFEERDLRYFKIFTDKSERLSNNTQLLCDNLIHLREALDATLNYNLNNTMKLFTIVTIIFQPLTLIVGWYGMNFTHMPELAWKFGYVYVIVLSIAVVTGILIYFKKKKYM